MPKEIKKKSNPSEEPRMPKEVLVFEELSRALNDLINQSENEAENKEPDKNSNNPPPEDKAQ